MALLALAPILAMAVYGAVATFRLYLASAEFSPVSAQVVERQDFTYVDGTDGRTRRVCLFHYAYRVNGTSYTGHRVTIGDDQASAGGSSRLCALMPGLPEKGERVTALVNPESPDTSIVIRQFPSSAITNAALMTLLWSALLLWYLLGGHHAQRRQ